MTVEPHIHPGTMFNLFLKGSVRINDVELGPGDWYLVPPGQGYQLETQIGYEFQFLRVELTGLRKQGRKGSNHQQFAINPIFRRNKQIDCWVSAN